MTSYPIHVTAVKDNHNHCFDFLKGMACIFVVFMHCEFPGAFGSAVQAISRFCVPFFFMLSGYYSYYQEGAGRFSTGRKLSHIGKITLYSSIFYLLVSLVAHFVYSRGYVISLSMVKNWLVFNQPAIVSGHLWFLFALLYCYMLFAIINRFKLVSVAIYLIPVLIAAYIVLAQGAHLAGVKLPNRVYRNFLIEGFPLFMFGYWLHRNATKVIERCHDTWLVVLLTASTVACLGERVFMGRDFGVNICTFPQVASLFILGMRHPGKFQSNILARLGARLSMLVYVLHIFVMWICDGVYACLSLANYRAALFLRPVAVLCGAFLLSAQVASVQEKYILRRKVFE